MSFFICVSAISRPSLVPTCRIAMHCETLFLKASNTGDSLKLLEYGGELFHKGAQVANIAPLSFNSIKAKRQLSLWHNYISTRCCNPVIQ